MSNTQPPRWSPLPSQPVPLNPRITSPQTVSLPTSRPTLLVAVSEADAANYAIAAFNRVVTHTTSGALQQIARSQPSLVLIDLDAPGIEAAEICHACAGNSGPCVLVITSAIERVPSVLKAGCHAVLLKPFAPNLLAARLGRLARDRGQQARMRSLRATADATPSVGTNRQWNSTECPHCRTSGAISFEFSSHRRMWYACLACENVWLGPRQE